ncbi:trigger factor [Lysobacter sp. TY2-98]|uniref:trigger factor n=1 Tax=Lysobacter sp. TY2-98 TaxID=2290922 RepID=UPI000E201EB0|nr:trigger factor [Lysobacter sp. TY2-98]AXK73632.1 trigger factor [Lysobacter sp. TY2-98]
MQVSVESVGNLERRMTLSLPADQLDSAVDARLREIARTAKLKGFRPGKVPAKVIEQRFGGQVRSEILDRMLGDSFRSAVSDNKLQIAGQPRIEPSTGDDGQIAFVANFEVVPDFGDIDVAKLNVIRHTAEVTDADIDTMIENLRMQRRSWQTVERGSLVGDLVEFQTWSQAGDQRVPAEGVEHGADVIGSGMMFETIEQQLTGMKAGESKQFDVDFPADWRVAEFAGRTVQVNITVSRVAEAVMPEIDADFIKSFGVKSGDPEQFRAEIRSNLERELKGALMNRLRREVGDQLIAAYEHVELPPRLVENEARAVAAQAVDNARRQGQPAELNDEVIAQVQDPARKRVLVGLLVGEIARRNDLRLDPRRVNETMRLIASTYEEPQQVIELYRNDANLMQSLQNRVMEEQVIDWIAERAQHTEQSLSFAEAIRQ